MKEKTNEELLDILADPDASEDDKIEATMELAARTTGVRTDG